ncbi:MAG: tripartite tricarboxylate transporter substrate binding protein BugD [Alphaproteobacteria bacterium]|nr:tripartite tricarboxylate transporter substrate binding protein BugD [Alphaproteobacteria bacterium]
MISRRSVLSAAAAFGVAATVDARAQSYPSRPITLVSPFPAGGAADTIARVLAAGMQQRLGQSVVVENVTGGGGSIGAGRVARAAGDGYTLCVGSAGSHVINGATMSLPYDVVDDFTSIALLSTQPLIIVSRKDLPTNDLKGLIAWLKDNPDKATQGTTGLGSILHLSGALFQKLTDTRFAFVPYRGANLAMQDLLAGRIDIIIDLSSLSIPLVKAEKIKAYAVMADRRLPGAPDVPTVDEAGLPGFYGSVWIALWAPKDTPRDIVSKLNATVVEILADASVRSRLDGLGQQIFPREQQTPEALADFQRREVAKWVPIAKAAGLKVR